MLSNNYPHPACYKTSFRPGRITTGLLIIRPEGHFTIGGRRIWKNSQRWLHNILGPLLLRAITVFALLVCPRQLRGGAGGIRPQIVQQSKIYST
jgi:hypothetical protein